MKIYKRLYVTLIEMMIVMFLIMLIVGVLAFNISGSLEKGKVFATQAGMKKVEQILNLATAEDPNLLDHLESNWKVIVQKSPLSDGSNSLIRDGWGNEYEVHVEEGQIVVYSKKYDDYQRTHATHE